MGQISQLCDEILQEHLKLGRDLDRLLLPGLSKAKVISSTSILPITLPKTAAELFTWRNGTQTGIASFYDMALFPVWYLMSLNEATSTYVDFQREFPDLLDRRYFPLFSSGAGDFIGIDCGENRGADGKIACYRQATGTVIEFENLKIMLRTILDSFRSNVFLISDEGRFKTNRTQFREIAKRLNPSLERWSPEESD
tara:strand:+ start:474 stop:1064 length:591 start_codon:yes stop_codon:yes gene_type:complete